MWLLLLALICLFGFMVFTGAPYVPTKPKEAKKALTVLYPLGPDDTIIDIGSGDGLVLRAASRLGARAVGYEINPVLALLSKLWSWRDKNVTVYCANFWSAVFTKDVTVVYTFGDARDIVRMYKKVQDESSRLKRPIAFISYGFTVPGYPPAKTVGAHHLYQVKPLH
ncbi:MAG: hypothetical protein WAQ25_04560 [Candidatus Saccharimonas sp.]